MARATNLCSLFSNSLESGESKIDSKNYPPFDPEDRETFHFARRLEIDPTTGLTVVNDSLDVLFESRRNLGILESSRRLISNSFVDGVENWIVENRRFVEGNLDGWRKFRAKMWEKYGIEFSVDFTFHYRTILPFDFRSQNRTKLSLFQRLLS